MSGSACGNALEPGAVFAHWLEADPAVVLRDPDGRAHLVDRATFAPSHRRGRHLADVASEVRFANGGVRGRILLAARAGLGGKWGGSQGNDCTGEETANGGRLDHWRGQPWWERASACVAPYMVADRRGVSRGESP